MAATRAAVGLEVVTIHGFEDHDDIYYEAFGCPGQPASNYYYDYRLGGARGHQATGFQFDGTGVMAGLTARVQDPTALASVTWSTLHPDAPVNANADGYALAQYYPNNFGDEDGYWFALSPLFAGSSGWQGSGDLADIEFSWAFLDIETDEVDPNRGYQGTVADLALDYDSDGYGAYVGFAYGCTGRTFSMDNMRVTSAGSDRIYDFEGARSGAYISATLEHKTDAPVIRDVTRINLIHGQDHYLLGDGYGFSDGVVASDWTAGTVHLYRRLYGTPSFRYVTARTFLKTTYGQFRITPAKQTLYQVRTLPGETFAGSTSKTLVVTVKRRISATLARDRVRRGRQIVVTGRIAPADRDVIVRLQKRVDGKWYNLSSSRTASGGYYKLSTLASTAGKRVLRVSVVTAKGNLGNVSPSLVVTVLRYRPPATRSVSVVNPIPPTHEPDIKIDDGAPHDGHRLALSPLAGAAGSALPVLPWPQNLREAHGGD
ncbi:hypothetical protein [Nocardioides sp. WS12]|uniref:hypothetical protein n=1 Tax=Nocardioides sp. WS12 TaxID=2486272 RepID=UPI0015F81339|nr:hypothetical protein [Nocardioides sp. WS12]